MSTTQICAHCHQDKPLSEFYLDRGRPRKDCKKCFRARQDPQKKLRNQKKYYRLHRQERLDYNHNYYELNKEGLKSYQKIYNHVNRQKVRTLQRKIHKRNRSNPIYRIKRALRARVSQAVKNKAQKAAGTSELVGCSIAQLIRHLEIQFQPGMTWDNYGDWHIDHIRPCASFDFSNPEHQRACFHYSNLQPLWARDNLTKGDSISESVR